MLSLTLVFTAYGKGELANDIATIDAYLLISNTDKIPDYIDYTQFDLKAELGAILGKEYLIK